MAEYFNYIVDVDTQKGDINKFEAHVENNNGDTVFEVTSYDHINELITDGHLAHGYDIHGLFDYLVKQKVISENDVLSY